MVASLLEDEFVEVWGEGENQMLLTVDTVGDFGQNLKLGSLGVTNGLTTEFVNFPLSKDSNGDYIGDGYEQAEKYGIAQVITTDGKVDLHFLEIAPSPYPAFELELDWYYNENDTSHQWGISLCGNYSFSKSVRSAHYAVCFKLKNGDSQKRIADKKAKGFVLEGKRAYKPESRTFVQI